MGAVVLTLVLAGGFYGAFYAVRNEMYQARMYFDTNRSVRYAEERLTRDIREAIEVTSTHGAYTTGNSILILKLPAIDASGDATDIAADFDYVTYRLDTTVTPNTLVRSLDVLDGTSQREGGADRTNKVIARRMLSLAFSSGGTALGSLTATQKTALEYVNVQMSAQGTTIGKSQTTSVDADVMLRNKLS
jgi:hypothetical protein